MEHERDPQESDKPSKEQLFEWALGHTETDEGKEQVRMSATWHYQAFDQEMSDRDVILIGGAMLERKLEHLYASLLPETVKYGLFKPFHPLSSFAGKVDVGMAFRIITSTLGQELHSIRRIRNEFAHSFDDELTLNSPTVKKHVDKLRTRQSLIAMGGETAAGAVKMAPDPTELRAVFNLSVLNCSAMITRTLEPPVDPKLRAFEQHLREKKSGAKSRPDN